ncbi:MULTISPECIES: carboxypeptidase-like regulatory domain-containing protein [unclassified Aeromicrobium]|uniref:carboxypeptidase-like regulatory domain-containing protein n=1 Tax=unclassified Aeromicrobium TaxID=2633570 RepID=UPI00288B8955|nr:MULTISPECIES: carboxypeptidase-like regulatory domain-containing protein [unclassified Aeromicrobium]
MKHSLRTGRRIVTLVVAGLSCTLATVGAITVPASDAATTTTTVKGGVYAAGERQAGVKVRLMLLDPDSGDSYDTIATTTTDARGAFTMSPRSVVSGGRYELWYDDPDRDIVSGWRAIAVKRGTTTSKAITARVGSTITGWLAYPDGTSPSSARVYLEGLVADSDFPTRGPLADDRKVYPVETAVRPGGSFRFKGLPRGEYHLVYEDASDRFLSLCHDGDLAKAGGSPTFARDTCPETEGISVGIGEAATIPVRTFEARSSRISGRVTNSARTPIEATVTAYPENGSSPSFTTYTTKGSWAVDDLPPGTWQVKVIPTEPRYAARWYLNGVYRPSSTVIPTTAGQETTGRNVVLPLRR